MDFQHIFQRARQRVRRDWSHRENNRRMRRLASQVAAQTVPTGQPVVFFNASTRLTGVSLNAAFSQLAAWSLRLSGTPVVHFVCQAGMSRCVLGTNRDNPADPPPCAGCVAQSRALYSGADVRWFGPQRDPALEAALDGLDLDQLAQFTWEGVPLGTLVLPALRWVLRRHHLVDDETTRFFFRLYLLAAENIARQFATLLDEVKPRCVVVFNGQFYPEATARWVAQQRGLRVISHEVGLLPFTGFFTPGEATAYPIEMDESFQLNPAQNARLDSYLEKRLQGNFSMAGVQFWPEMRPLGQDFWQRAAQFEQIVPVFTNVIFDTSQGHANVLYEHMFAWLDDVLEIIRAHPRTLFIIRAHPDEARPGKESRESVAQWVTERGAERLPNLLFVDAGEYFSSYELIQKSRFVMVYNSTIGLEASLLGAAVLCAGRARFTQLPTVFFPQTAAEFRQMAERFLSEEAIVIPPEFRRNARRFLYYQLFRTSLPFQDFLEEDGVWRGYVRLKDFPPAALLPVNNETMKIIHDGILHDRPFLLEP